jgi:sugar lactone lactonase YvrE
MKRVAIVTVALLVCGVHIAAQTTYQTAAVAGWLTAGSRDGAAADAQFNFSVPSSSAGDALVGMVRDSGGNIFLSDIGNSTIRRVTAAGVVTTFAGAAGVTGLVDGTGTSARFTRPSGLTIDAADNLFVADFGNLAIRKITPAGVVTTVYSGPEVGQALALVPDGSIITGHRTRPEFTTTSSPRLYRISTSGQVTFLAGGSRQSEVFARCVDGSGAAAEFTGIYSIVRDPATGDFIIGDSYTSPGFPGGCSFRRVTLSGDVTTVAGTAGIQMAAPTIDPAGRLLWIRTDAFGGPLFIGGSTVPRLLVRAGETVYPVTATFPPGSYRLLGMVRAADGTLVVATSDNTLYRLTLTDAGTPSAPGPFSVTAVQLANRALSCAGDVPMDGNRLATRFCDVRSLTFDAQGAMYVVDASYTIDLGSGISRVAGYTVRRIGLDGQSSTLAGRIDQIGSTDGPGASARFGTREQREDGVLGIAVSPDGAIYVADQANSTIRRIAADGTTTTLVGVAGVTGTTDGDVSVARMNRPHDLAFDSAGNLYVADTGNSSIRKITPSGQVSTFAGLSASGGSADGTGAAARFSSPYGIAVGPGSVVYVADTGNHTIRAISPSGQVTTLAGQVGAAGHVDGAGTSARFNAPRSVAVVSDGTVFVGDRPASIGTRYIRRISSTGSVTTVLSSEGEVGDVDGSGVLYLAGGPTVRVAASDTPVAPAITTSPLSQTVTAGQMVTFTAGATGSPSPTYQWQVFSDGGSTWTNLSNSAPYSGVTTASLFLSSSQVSYPLRRFRVVATNALGSATSAAAVLTVPGLLAQPSSLRFRVAKSGALGMIQEHPPQDVQATFVGIAPAALTWSANQPWVSLSPSASGPVASVLIADPSNALLGTTTASAVITVSGGGQSTQIPVSLEVVLDPSTTVGPIGQVDTPAQGATGVRGAVAISGWATDDIGTGSVVIYRNCVPAEPQYNCQAGRIPGRESDLVVLLGSAQLVPGARPDIDAAFPHLPTGNRAGWGFLLLTNMLPRTTGTFSPYGGQGAITLYAVASDYDGHKTLLGRSWSNDATPTTITLDNDAIAKPFGTIDTPAQGERISSATFNNFGWVLTPDTDTVAGNSDIEIANASGLMLFIDGMPISSITYNQCRGNVGNPVPGGVFCNDDVANIFGNTSAQSPLTTRTSNPTKFRNLDAGRGAMGSAVLDITGLSNGLHTIAWSATDSASRVEGIGSRYFSVLRPQTTPATDAGLRAPAGLSSTPSGQLYARSGFGLQTPFAAVSAAADGVRRLQIPSLGRVELFLGGTVDSAGLVIDGQTTDLPVGALLNVATGQFTWMPGPAFLGTHRLAFMQGATRTEVEVAILATDGAEPGGSEVRMSTPMVRGCEALAAHDCHVQGRVTITGDAWDPHAFTGSGIGAIHVWGLRRDQPTAAPVFLGAAEMGDGNTFTFTTTLERGMYDVTAYVWNTRTSRFEDARTVRVTVR